MPKLKDSRQDLSHPKVLIYGPAGTGKTALALTLGGRAWVLDTDGGLRSGLSIKDKFAGDRQNVEWKDCVERNPLNPAAYKKFKTWLKSFWLDCYKGQAPAKAIIIDSWTTVNEACINYVMSNQGSPGKGPQLQHWGLIIRELEEVLVLLRAIPVTVVVLAHRTFYQDEESGDGDSIQKSTVMCSGSKLPEKFLSIFDEIWLSRVIKTAGGNFDFKLTSAPNPYAITRSRGGLPEGSRASEGLVALLKKTNFDIDPQEKGKENVPNPVPAPS
jgi:hypothetical protein